MWAGLGLWPRPLFWECFLPEGFTLDTINTNKMKSKKIAQPHKKETLKYCEKFTTFESEI
jgi:hypothetical protein